MEKSGHSQELQNPNMELKVYMLDWRLKEVEKTGVPQESNSFSSSRGVIGEPIAIFTPKL